MKLNSVGIQEGYHWIRQGFWLFKQNPLAFLMLVFIYVLVAQLAILIPIIGVITVLVLTPTLSVGFMTACRQAIQKERIVPQVYFCALRSTPLIRKRILQLGLLYAIMIFGLSLILGLFINVQAIIPLISNDQAITPEAIHQLYWALLIGGLLYFPIAVLMWFSPVLIAWENMSIPQALFSSWIACWKNRGAFLYYILIWAAILAAIPLLVGASLDTVNLGQAASFIIAPISMGGLTIMHCSFYASWKGCFIADEAMVLGD
ncbi:hypothetical protein G6733_06915 [Polynucleobacter paneuropaeus]|nr:hypothetical protein G6733_06915 [Polynucleobacter paneuropaeus]